MKILLPIDNSDCSNATIKWAVNTFGKTNTTYHLLYVISVYPDANELEYDILDAKALLAKGKDVILKLGGNKVICEYTIGDVVYDICEYANEIDPDLVIVGSHGKSPLKKVVLGSVSADVLQRCKKPVVVYRNADAAKAIHLT